MSEDFTSNASNILNVKPHKITPIYFVSMINHEDNDCLNFICTKFDDCVQYVKVIGFFTKFPISEIKEKYNEIISSSDRKIYEELMVPWTQINYISNLIYKQK